MLSVIIIWLYMLITCYVTGFACIRVIAGNQGFRCRRQVNCLYAGIGVMTVYSQFFSIFWKVGFFANLFLTGGCIICIFLFRREFADNLHTCRLTIRPMKAIILLVLFLLFAYGTSTGIIHYDTSLYHAQSIRWIEEYGVVPGLGNLHSRLAYNSSAFCLSALYSMSFLGGQSYHCCAGFLAFLLAVVCAEGMEGNRVTRSLLHKPVLSDFARILGVYYLLNIFDEMISPASDYFMVLLVFFVVIRWLELIENRETSYLPYAMLSVFCVLIFTVKLSGAMILILVLKPAAVMIKEKRFKEIGRFFGVGILTAIPFLVRNIILSGWLIYPFTSIDLFSFDFKIPSNMADYDAREIQVWGRGFTDVKRYGEPAGSWLPEWFQNLDGTNKLFFIMAISGTVCLFFFIIYVLIRRKTSLMDYIHVEITFTACFLFWLFSAPLIRYGCVFLWLTAVLIWGHFYLIISPHLDRFRIYMIALILVGAYKLTSFGAEAVRGATAEYIIKQKDYERFEMQSYVLHGYTFYYPVDGDRTGYDVFPASPLKAEDIFRGETIEEGFKDVIHQ